MQERGTEDPRLSTPDVDDGTTGPEDFAIEEPVTEQVESSVLMDRRRLVTYVLTVVVIVAALYFVLPKITETKDALAKLDEANP